MVDQRIIDFIRTNLLRGVTKEQIKLNLIKAGWPENLINDSMNLVTQEMARVAVPMSIEPEPEPKRFPMFSVIIIIAILVGVIIVGSMFLIPTSSIKDCGTDTSCYQINTENCGPVKVKLVGVEDEVSMQLEPKTTELCQLNITFEKTTNVTKKVFEGKAAECNFYKSKDLIPEDKTIKLFINSSAPPPEIKDIPLLLIFGASGDYCSGPLVDEFIKKIEQSAI